MQGRYLLGCVYVRAHMIDTHVALTWYGRSQDPLYTHSLSLSLSLGYSKFRTLSLVFCNNPLRHSSNPRSLLFAFSSRNINMDFDRQWFGPCPCPTCAASSRESEKPAIVLEMGSTPPADLKCWICLESYNREQDGSDWRQSWRRICPCNLYAHEKCLLSWASSAAYSGSDTAPSCPQCKRVLIIEKSRSITLLVRDTLESWLSKASTAFAVITACGSVGTAVAVALCPLGAWTILTVCPKELSTYLLDGSYGSDGVLKLHLDSRSAFLTALVPFALGISTIDSYITNWFLVSLPLVCWDPFRRVILAPYRLAKRLDTFVGISPASEAASIVTDKSFLSEKIAFTLYPVARLGYFYLHNRYITPIIKRYSENLHLPRPSSAPLFDINIIVENDEGEPEEPELPEVRGLVPPPDLNNRDMVDQFMRFAEVFGRVEEGEDIFWENGRLVHRQPDGDVRPVNFDVEQEAGDIRRLGFDEEDIQELFRRPRRNRVRNNNRNGDNNREDNGNWAVSKQRPILRACYALAWPWLSSQVGDYLGNFPLILKLLPSSFNRNLLASVLVILGRDLFNLLTIYLRSKVDKSSHVLNYSPKKFNFLNWRLWML